MVVHSIEQTAEWWQILQLQHQLKRRKTWFEEYGCKQTAEANS
jgi:hypothetical protein